MEVSNNYNLTATYNYGPPWVPTLVALHTHIQVTLLQCLVWPNSTWPLGEETCEDVTVKPSHYQRATNADAAHVNTLNPFSARYNYQNTENNEISVYKELKVREIKRIDFCDFQVDQCKDI